MLEEQSFLFQELQAWRDATAKKQGKETYRVLPNASLRAIALLQPKTLAELETIKGIKSVKSHQYGTALLTLIQKHTPGTAVHNRVSKKTAETDQGPLPFVLEQPEPLTISQFLDGINLELSGMAARIRGEVTSLDVRERVVYFSLKDQEDTSVLSCLMFRYQYEMAGIKLALGDEVILEGVPNIYKPSGRLSFRAETVEYAGEGALKKAYDELFQKLTAEGLMAVEKKRTLPLYPERIGLITSSDGAALGDFMSNLCRAGMQITLYPTLVEGKRAVREILGALQWFNSQADLFDVVVIIRGGGSLESLQAFNTEALVRAVATMKIPILAGIGHERDISLVALAADKMVSTPTAAAKTLSSSWDEARQRHDRYAIYFQQQLEQRIQQSSVAIERQASFLQEQFRSLSLTVEQVQQSFREHIAILPERLRSQRTKLERVNAYWMHMIEHSLRTALETLHSYTLRLEQYHPKRALQLGYSLVRREGQIIRRAENLVVGDCINIELGSGTIEGEVTRISS